MGYHIATAALSPLLIWQGKIVRRRTPRLPEASGERTGVTGRGPSLRLIVLGDSSAAGVGVATQAQALVGQTVAELAERYCVSWELVAATGMTTGNMIARLREHPRERFDVAVTALGVNDVTRRRPLQAWLDEQRTLWELLRQRFGVSRIIVSGLPPVHSFPALPQPLRWYLGSHATRLNGALLQMVRHNPYCRFIDLRQLTMSAMAADGFHPGAEAYVRWGALVATAIDDVP